MVKPVRPRDPLRFSSRVYNTMNSLVQQPARASTVDTEGEVVPRIRRRGMMVPRFASTDTGVNVAFSLTGEGLLSEVVGPDNYTAAGYPLMLFNQSQTLPPNHTAVFCLSFYRGVSGRTGGCAVTVNNDLQTIAAPLLESFEAVYGSGEDGDPRYVGSTPILIVSTGVSEGGEVIPYWYRRLRDAPVTIFPPTIPGSSTRASVVSHYKPGFEET